MVRWAEVCSLTRFADALGYLVELTAVRDPLIRDWSCFELYLTRRDLSEVREALVARFADDDAITRAEALRASANIGDPRRETAVVPMDSSPRRSRREPAPPSARRCQGDSC